jgi:hypothetical protein
MKHMAQQTTKQNTTPITINMVMHIDCTTEGEGLAVLTPVVGKNSRQAALCLPHQQQAHACRCLTVAADG